MNEKKKNLEIELLKEEIFKNKAANRNYRTTNILNWIKCALPIIGAALLFFIIQKPDSILNRKLSEESIARERAKLILEVLNYEDPAKVSQGISVIKATYGKSNKWIEEIEAVILQDALYKRANNLWTQYQRIKSEVDGMQGKISEDDMQELLKALDLYRKLYDQTIDALEKGAHAYSGDALSPSGLGSGVSVQDVKDSHDSSKNKHK